MCAADASILSPLDLVPQLVDDEIQGDLGLGACCLRSDPAVTQVQDHRATGMVGNARIALVGKVDFSARQVAGNSLEPTELALRHRSQARRDLDVVTPNDDIHARPSMLGPVFSGGLARGV